MANKLLTVKEVAEMLGMHEVTIRDKCREGEIPAIKMGKYWRVKEDDLNKWLENQR